MADTIVGPWTVPDGDPVLDNAMAALPLLRPKVIDLYAPGQILLQSLNRPKRAPQWAWGYTPSVKSNWVSEKHPYVIEEYTINHELGHPFDTLYLIPADRVVLMRQMGLTVPDGLTDAQINRLWNRGSYTSKACYVPREGFADAFAKAQAQAPLAPVDPKANGFVNVLPHFYKVGFTPDQYPWFLGFIKAL